MDADAVIVLPDNRNIIMAAQQVPSVADQPGRRRPDDVGARRRSRRCSRSTPTRDARGERRGDDRGRLGACAPARSPRRSRTARARSGRSRRARSSASPTTRSRSSATDVADVAARLLDVIADGGETLTRARRRGPHRRGARGARRAPRAPRIPSSRSSRTAANSRCTRSSWPSSRRTSARRRRSRA